MNHILFEVSSSIISRIDTHTNTNTNTSNNNGTHLDLKFPFDCMTDVRTKCGIQGEDPLVLFTMRDTEFIQLRCIDGREKTSLEWPLVVGVEP